MMDMTADLIDFNSLDFYILARDRLTQIEQEDDQILCPHIDVQQCSNLTDAQTEPSPNNRDFSTANTCMSEKEEVQLAKIEQELYTSHPTISNQDRDQISAIIQIVIQGSKGRSQIRLDEISKQVVRKLFKNKKHQFMMHLEDLEHSQIPEWEETQEILKHFLTEKYGLSSDLLTEHQILIAKSIFYNFTARRNDQTLGATEKQRIAFSRVKFCERGTKQEALKFFKSRVASRVIYPGFFGALRELSQQDAPESIKRQKRLIERYLEQIYDVQQ